MSHQNEIFFAMLRHVLDEQEDIDWAFKTSLLFVKGFNANLAQTPIDTADQVENLLEYLKETKPYHTNFSGLTEKQSATLENVNLQVTEIVNPKTTIHFDRVSCVTDLPGYDTEEYDFSFDLDEEELGYDNFDVQQANLSEAANRISIFYEPGTDEEKKSIEELMDCDFQGLLVSGGAINIDEIGYDSQFFEKFGYDVPVREAFYEVSSTPTLDFIDYGLLIDAATDTDDYGFINAAATTTLDWGTVDVPVPAPPASVTFPLPYVPFETKKVWVYFDQPDGTRTLTTETYTVEGLNVVFDVPPPVGVVIYIAVIDYEYLYDKIYAPGEDWDPTVGDEDVILEGEGFLRPHWDRNHPQELSPIRVLENLEIRVYTNQAQVLGSDPGYDDSPYDTLGYDLAEEDLSLSTGGGPDVSTEEFYKSEIPDTYELSYLPQSSEAILVFEDGLITRETTDYTVSWNDPTYDDTSERDDHITNPRVTLVTPPVDTTKMTFMHYGFGGSPIQKRLITYDTNLSAFDLEVVITDPGYVFATVNGEVATTSVSGSIVTINTPVVPAGATVAITVFTDITFTEVQSQIETSAITATLDNPPTSTVPGYMGIQAWDLATGKRLRAPYTKVYLAEAGEDTYTSSAPVAFAGTYAVYLNQVLQTEGIGDDYTVSGNDIIFNSIPSLNAEIFILGFGSEEFVLSDTVVANDTLTASNPTDLRIITLPEDLSMGMRNECYHGNSNRAYDIGNVPTTIRDIWVYMDGVLQFEGIDYSYIVDSLADTRTIQFLDDTLSHLNSVIQITYTTERSASRPAAFRMIKTPRGDFEFKRIADKHTTELVGEYDSGIDQTISVKDAAVLGQPSPVTVPAAERIPGRIYIDGELIEFWGIDYSVSPHLLTGLRPGVNGNGGMGLNHSTGTKVVDASSKQDMPKKIEVEKRSRINYRTQQSGIFVHNILGEITDPTEVSVWVREATELAADLEISDDTIIVQDSSVFTLPSPTTLTTDIANPAGSIKSGDVLRIQLNGGAYEFLSLTGTDAASVETDVEALPGLFDRGLTASVAADIITFSHAGGGALNIENSSGYALQDLFGGQTTGTVTTPVVTFGSGEGIVINGTSVEFTSTALANVVADINAAGIENIIARDKDDRLQIVNLVGGAITLANLVGTALTELGIASSVASTILVVNGTLLQAQGTRIGDTGALWIDQEKIEFGYYDPSETGAHILGELTRSFIGVPVGISYPSGKVIVGSKQELKTRNVDYSVFGRQIKFVSGLQPATGSLIRIQNRPNKGKLIIPDEIQTSNSVISRFLQEAPGNR